MIGRMPTAWVRAAPAILLVVLAGACREKPKVTGIEIVPAHVTVGSDPLPTSFQLEARLWGGSSADRWSIVESDGYKNLHWTVDPASRSWLQVTPHGFRATVTVKGNAAPASPGFITIKAGGKTTAPGVRITVAPATVSGQDVLRAGYVPDQAPSIAIVNGIRSGEGACTLSFTAFVRWLPVGQLDRPCAGTDAAWGAAVLARDHGSMFTSFGWTGNDDEVEGAPLQGALRIIPVALRVMVAPNELDGASITDVQNEALALGLADLQVANSMLAENRVGVQLAITDTRLVDVTDPTVVADCKTGDDQTATEDLDGVLNVYHVNQMGALRGFTCEEHETTRKNHVIYLAWEDHPHSTETLVHEVGHALGLMLPGAGHTNMVAGLDGTNIMATGPDDRDPAGRSRFTVGQAFRLNAESASWLNLAMDPDNPARPIREANAARVDCQCGKSDPAGRCPRVADDVATPSEKPSGAQTRSCFDEVQLSPRTTGDAEQSMPPEEDPAAIAAGRLWRARPRNCSTPDVRGTSSRRSDVFFIEIPNLTRPGTTCGSWIALFFSNGGVVHRKLAEPEALWNPTSDLVVLPYPVSPLLDLKVLMHAAPNDWHQDEDYALKTFGPENRSGMKLTFDEVANCPAPSPDPAVLCVSYTSPGAGEGAVSPNGIIKVSILNRKESTVAHLIGSVLGLPEAGTAFGKNVMRRDPNEREPRLTLGQVYRASAKLNSSLPGCTAIPNLCPSLTAGVQP